MQPVSRAASTNSFSRMLSTSPWITRVIGVQYTMPMTRIRIQMLGLSTLTSATANRMMGNAIITSVMRMSKVSTPPRK